MLKRSQTNIQTTWWKIVIVAHGHLKLQRSCLCVESPWRPCIYAYSKKNMQRKHFRGSPFYFLQIQGRNQQDACVVLWYQASTTWGWVLLLCRKVQWLKRDNGTCSKSSCSSGRQEDVSMKFHNTVSFTCCQSNEPRKFWIKK